MCDHRNQQSAIVIVRCLHCSHQYITAGARTQRQCFSPVHVSLLSEIFHDLIVNPVRGVRLIRFFPVFLATSELERLSDRLVCRNDLFALAVSWFPHALLRRPRTSNTRLADYLSFLRNVTVRQSASTQRQNCHFSAYHGLMCTRTIAHLIAFDVARRCSTDDCSS
jgi:hypothetical protein